MHEYSLADALVRRVEEEARKRGATAVKSIRVTLGELGGVEARFLQSAYEMVREGTLCDQAELLITVFPAEFRCPTCGKIFGRGDVLHCEKCDQPAQLSEVSEALQLESVEMEVP